jgi:WD repeat-containing protein 48
VPIQSFGKRHLEDVEPEVNTREAVAPWCSIDTRTGRLAVVLEEYNCFDAEVYADEIQTEEPIEFREDQRSKSPRNMQDSLPNNYLVNLGKWILRHMFSKLIDELIKRDETIRKQLNESAKTTTGRAPMSIQLPTTPFSFQDGDSSTTPRGNGMQVPMTPGMNIGVATPAPVPSGSLPGVPEGQAFPDMRASQNGQDSGNGDYFTNAPMASVPDLKTPVTPSEPPMETPKSPYDADKTNGKEGGLFGKKFKMGMSFGSKKLGRSSSTATQEKPVVEAEKPEGSDTSEPVEKEVEDNFSGILQKIQMDYEKHLLEHPDKPIETGINPSSPNETPVLKPPELTTVIIQEETSGGSADLYRGTVGTAGEDADLIIQRAPMWLGDLLLRVNCSPSTKLVQYLHSLKNRIHFKEPVKVSFILQPWQDLLPGIAGADG